MTSTCRRPGFVAVAASMALLAASPAGAQINKCIDKSGRTTYQQQACPESQKALPLAISVDNGGARDTDAMSANWERAVREKRVETGMPRAYVIRALGNPREMRGARTDENAVEVWVYRRGDLDAKVGFRKGVVSFYNDAGQGGAPPPTSDVPMVRAALSPGMECGRLPQSLGKTEAVAEAYDPAIAQLVTRMTWGPTTAEPERTVVTCIKGAITQIDRTPANP